MSRIIIGIHGMGNKPEAVQLRKWWKEAIREGFRGIGRLRYMRFELVYWASFLHHLPLKSNCTDTEDPYFLEEPFIKGLTHLENYSDRPLSRKLHDKINAQLENLFIEEDGTPHFSSLTDFIIKHFVKDLAAYYQSSWNSENSMRNIVCLNLARSIEKHRKKKILLIAHSMGSIIAWDVLTKYVPHIDINTFVTIGSPLGLPFVRSRILQYSGDDQKEPVSTKTPGNITGSWFNLADYKDRVAFHHDLRAVYLPNAHGIQVEDIMVQNNYISKGKTNHHKSYGYLGSPEMTKIVSNFYSGK